ncbi:MAG: alpha/beta fold hydrolase [Candidatus Eiseniibacteriota bacterium]|nr:MAG: alpha/beta fold hydrolase [Candidatus Eisenbacteria bacterium]
MKRKTKVGLLVAAGALAGVIIAVVIGVSWLMKQPLYRFGSVSSEKNLTAPLEPPEQVDGAVWQVEPGIGLHLDAFGEGRPVLVVHGGPGIPYASAWKGLRPLEDRFRFYYYHQRGCGESTRPFDRFESKNYYANMTTLERTLGLGAKIADVERIRRILGQEKLTIIGHSFGGFIASLYAAEFPQRVDRLILVAPAGVLTPPDEERNIFQLARERLPQEQHAAYDSVLAEYFDFPNIFSKSDSDLVTLHEACGEYLVKAMGYDSLGMKDGPTSGGWTVFALYFSMGRSYDFRSAVAEIEAPTLILHGADDEIALAGSRSYERSIPDSRFVLVGREEQGAWAGHSVFDDCPVNFATAVAEFLEAE